MIGGWPASIHAELQGEGGGRGHHLGKLVYFEYVESGSDTHKIRINRGSCVRGAENYYKIDEMGQELGSFFSASLCTALVAIHGQTRPAHLTHFFHF
jgi:hypothetical protein